MKWIVLLVFIFSGAVSSAQDNFYIGQTGDTVLCEFKKIFPQAIIVRTEANGKKTIGAQEIKSFKAGGIEFVAKKVMNRKKNTFIFLPSDKKDRKYLYSDPNLVMISGNGISFYELVEFDGPSEYGRGSTVTFYIENDALGLKRLPRASAVGGEGKEEVIAILREYLIADESIKEKLTTNEPWKTFNYKGIRKLMEEYTGKKLID